MGNCKSTCNTCYNCLDWCSCTPTPVVGECAAEISSQCIIYKPEGGISGIDKFIGFGTKRNLQDILERLDSKLYTYSTVQAPECARTLLGLPTVSDLSTVIFKTLEFLCTVDNSKVKVNSTDTTSGYLFDKIAIGECILKTVVTDNFGNKTLKIELDYDCVRSKINNEVWVDVSPSETVCTGNDLYKKQTNGEGAYRWVLVAVNHSSCISCTPTWVDASPIERSCVKTGVYSLQLKKKQVDGCGNVRWIDDAVFTWNNSSVDCSGASTVAQLQVVPNIPTEFAFKNDSNVYEWQDNGTNQYNWSGLPKDGSVRNFKARPLGLNCDIDGHLQMCTGTIECEETTWTDTDTTRCESNVSQIQQISNCGTTRWVTGGNACSQCTDPYPIISISADDNTICGVQIATLTASHNGCTTIQWYKRGSGGSGDTLLGTGSSITVSANATIYAKCTNCQGTVNSVGDVEIIYTSQCSESCNTPVFSLAKTCNTNTSDPNVWKTNVSLNTVSGDRYAVYPNSDGSGVVPNYSGATPITSSSMLIKTGTNVGDIVKVKVYNGSDNCFSQQAVAISASDCLDNCIEITSVTVTNNNANPLVNDTVIYTATPNGSAPFTYQWKIDGTPVSGAVNANFSKTWAAGDVGSRVVTVDVTNCITTGSSTGIANVTVSPLITTVTGSSNCD